MYRMLYFQVAAGTDIVKKTLDAFGVPTVATTVLLDVHGYDAFPSLCALEEGGKL